MIKMKGIIFIIRDYENKTKVKEMKVKKYYDCGFYYDLIFEDGLGSISKEKVIRIEKYG